MKIIFLDIDGVLNSWGTIIFFGRSTPSTPNFNPLSVEYLKSLITLSDSKVVIHSTWDTVYGFDTLVEMFVELGFDRDVFLPMPDNRSANRSERIRQSIELYQPDKYVVIDDRNLEDSFGELMVHVDQFNGFAYHNMLRAKFLMGVDFDKTVLM